MSPGLDKLSTIVLNLAYTLHRNFIDTANGYQDGESEVWIGEWMKSRGNRPELFIATKYSEYYNNPAKFRSTFVGNSTKSLRNSVEDSLRKLQTDYIDLLYVHWFDYTTSIEELMQSLNQLVLSGKVLYLGISDTPAWVVSKANQYARDHGLRPFSVYQGRWNAAIRDMEREIIPMCRDEGMAIAPFAALGASNFKPAEDYKKPSDGRKVHPPTAADIAVAAVLEKIAKEKNVPITSVALAYVLHKAPHVIPIVGARKLEHLKSSIEGLKVGLTTEEIKEIDGAAPFDPGFPNNVLFPNWDVTIDPDPERFWRHATAGQIRTVKRLQVSGSNFEWSVDL